MLVSLLSVLHRKGSSRVTLMGIHMCHINHIIMFFVFLCIILGLG